MKADGVFRYCVVPNGNRLEVPDRESGDLSGWIDDQNWSWAAPEEIRLPNGEAVDAPMLDVHVGEWPTDFDSREREQTAKYARRMHVEKQLWVEEHLFSPLGMTGKNEARGRMQNRREAAEVAETVDPKAHWTGPEELGAILESGSFQVDGAVFFNPLSPLQTDPRIPDADASPDDQLLAREPIKFNCS